MLLNQLVLFFGIICSISSSPTVLAYFGLTSRDPISTLLSNWEHNSIDERSNMLPSEKLCEMLNLHKKQKRMCRRGTGIAEALLEAIRISVIECHYQFRYERWNCSLVDPYRQRVLQKGFKETSFLHAVSSAGLVHSLSRACSTGRLDRCTCDESKHLQNEEAWRWGGCGDNIKFGLKFTRRFLKRAKRTGNDVLARVNRHNSYLGIKVVKNNVATKCKCHGVSGSCTIRTCWRQLSPFNYIGEILKNKYENSERVETDNNHANRKTAQRRRSIKVNVVGVKQPPRRMDMIHIDDSPSFCQQSRYSEGTKGRECIKERNCDSICCGRGHNVQTKIISRPCKCEVIWCCQFRCQQCNIEEEIHSCK